MAVEERSRRWLQYFACFAVSLTGLTTGVSMSWSAPVIPQIHNNETDLHNITEEEISWVASISSPGYMLGSLAVRFISDRFGRRSTIFSSVLPFIIGTIVILCSSNIWLLYLTRVLWGIATGMVNTVSPIYLAEISDKDIRGSVSSVNRFMMYFGNLIDMSVGPFVSYKVLSGVLLVLPICYFVACCFVPETPYYLLKVGKVNKARVALMKLSGLRDEKVLEDRLSLMRSHVKQEMVNSESAKELFTGRQYRKPLIISIGLRIGQTLGGSIAIQQYLGRIAQESKASVNVSTILIIFGVLKFVAGVISSVIVDKVGRRPLLVRSFLASGVIYVAVGAYFLIPPTSPLYYGYAPFAGIILSSVIGTIGFETLSYFIPAEIFPINVKSVAMTFLNIFGGFLNFVTVKSYQPMKDYAGISGVFWFYAVWSIIGALFTYYTVPETKGKTLREIQIELQGNSYDASTKLNQVVTKEECITESKELQRRASC